MLDGEIAWKDMEKLILSQLEQGVDGLVAVGTTGESPTLNDEEHIEVIRRTREIANGRTPVIAGTGAILSGRAGRLLTLLVDRLRPGPGRGRLRQLLGVLQDYRSHPRFVLRIAALALLVQAMRVSTHVLVTRAMGLSLEPERILQLYVLVPVLALAVVLPISFNGLGVRELVAQRLMPAIGISAESAVAMQLITYFVQVTVSLIGGVVFAVMMIRGQLRMRRGDPEGI